MQLNSKDIPGFIMVVIFIVLMIIASACKKLEPLISTKVDPDTIKVVVKNSEDTTVRLDFYNGTEPDTVVMYDTAYVKTFKGDTLYYIIKKVNHADSIR